MERHVASEGDGVKYEVGKDVNRSEGCPINYLQLDELILSYDYWHPLRVKEQAGGS